jgi:CheY-like chemotaxis protein
MAESIPYEECFYTPIRTFTRVAFSRDAPAKKKVLIVEDDRIIQQILAWRLDSLGYSVSGKAASAADALFSVKEKMPDAILMDVHLSGTMDGIETAMMLKKMYNLPIIFLTSPTETVDLNRVKKAHPDGYIVRPFNDTDLRVALALAIPDTPDNTAR